jgi:hypothetical protein
MPRTPRFLPALPAGAIAATAVGPSTIADAGEGLFAAQPIPKGSVVAKMQRLFQVTPQEAAQIETEFPHDAIVYVEDKSSRQRSVGYFDEVFREGTIPDWYRMNHQRAERANVRLEQHGNELRWVTKEIVMTGTELTWNYGEVPEHFN